MKKDTQILNEKFDEVTPSDLLKDVCKLKGGGQKPLVLLTGIRSDSHSWNLVYAQLMLEELGFEVVNLGANVPVERVQLNVLQRKPKLVVVSTVNGHGAIEGKEIAEALVKQGSQVPLVIGGLLTTQPSEVAQATEELLNGGYNAVFSGNNAVPEFILYIQSLADLMEAQL